MIFKIIICGFLLRFSTTTASPFRFNLCETHVDAPTPPKTDIGAFSVDASGHVYLYYESTNDLNNKHRNYVATELHHRINFVSAPNAFKYTDVPDRDLTIFVYSENAENEWSEFVSFWRVPQMSQRCAKPTNLTLVEKSEHKTEIRWMAPEIESKAKHSHSMDICSYITSYTVFWCESESKQPNSCEGSIQFVRIGAERAHNKEFSYHLKTDKSLIIAVSANSPDSSSGMVWLNDSNEDMNFIWLKYEIKEESVSRAVCWINFVKPNVCVFYYFKEVFSIRRINSVEKKFATKFHFNVSNAAKRPTK